MIAASVSTRVVSWNDAAEMKESVDSDALVIPSSTFFVLHRQLVGCVDAVVLFQQLRTLHLLADDVVGVASIGDLHTTQHLANEHFDVLVVDLHTLQTVHVLHFADDVAAQRFDTQQAQDVLRIGRAVHDHLVVHQYRMAVS
jgi:hypothetical protein